MRQIIEMTAAEVLPDPQGVSQLLGRAEPAPPNTRTAEVLETAIGSFREHASPLGLFASVSVEEFSAIYRGDGRNELHTPLDEIYARADHLALFAVTLGAAISSQIADLFACNDFALAAILDAAASDGTERAAERVENRYREQLRDPAATPSEPAILRYSPGYCGWHMSGQKTLFEYLQPEEIGIRLRESFLMEPLKSISGVMVAGKADIHVFDDTYPFCAECTAHGCRQRIRSVAGGSASR